MRLLPFRLGRPASSAAPLAVAALVAVLMTAAPAEAARAPRLTGARCVPAGAAGCANGVAVRVGRQVQLRGVRLRLGMRVSFRWSRGAIATTLHRGRPGWVARVPPGVRAGAVNVTVRDAAGRRSNAVKIKVVAPAKPVSVPARTGGPAPAVFTGNGMWIWQLDQSDGGNVDTLAARAAAAGVGTVFVKAGDGNQAWPQFSPLLVGALHAHGLRACAWQYVYGTDPTGEASVAAAAVSTGADCFVIDAESEYEGRYAAAQTYMSALRAAVGPSYPLGLTSFPYVDYHPGLPYSVFLGPGAAQVNLPQVYWKQIGGGVDAVSAHTLAHNRIYGAPIAPLGQTYNNPSADDIRRFRQLWAAWGSPGLSWWSWQATDAAHWSVLAESPPAPTVESDPGWPALGTGAKGDEVVWLQEHLTATYPSVTVTGRYDSATAAAISQLQTSNGIPVTGTTDASTWQIALKLPYAAPDWTAGAAPTATAKAARKREIPRVDARRR